MKKNVKIIAILVIINIIMVTLLSLFNYNTNASNQKVSSDINSIDSSKYPGIKEKIQSLKSEHPNWNFKILYTGIDWNEAITYEYLGHGKSPKNLVPDSSSYTGEWVCGYCGDKEYDSGSWRCASESALKYMMDPRASLNSSDVFQFLELSYDSGTGYSRDTVKKMVSDSFLDNDTYINAIMDASQKNNVNPYYITARILQEQGKSGTVLTKGQGYNGQYPGVYNVFNISASGGTKEKVILNGLKKAQDRGWNTLEKSIYGGIEIIASKYIAVGQNTMYFQKFDVENSDGKMYTHQYMQNIAAPTSEARSVKKQYDGAGALDNTFVFKIPVYENMPDTACPMPTASNSVSLEIPSGYDTSVVYVDGIAYTPSARDGRYTVTLADDNAKCAVVFQYNDQKVPVGMYVWTLQGEDGKYTATKQPELKDILTYHGFSVRVTGKMGIRFKSGISTDLRAQLAGQGVDGYRLKEYGTLLMTNVDRMTYPMVKGGEKVISSMAFGYNPQGVLEDNVYDTVAGRYIYTAVLIGIPAEQYTTEYAFCGYITLTKDGVGDVTIYGPTVAKSMYAVAEQVLNNGTYSQGSKEDQYLRKILSNVR